MKVRLKRSRIGCTQSQKKTLAALGLRKVNQVREYPGDAPTRGQIEKVKHLVEVIES
jgi:large subunit ribosomal protein L30